MAITGRRPAFVALCALTLTLSVGANLAVFTVVNAIWLRPRPVADPDRLVVITNLSAAGGPRPIDMVKSAELGDFARTPVFEGVTGQLAPGELLGDFRPTLVINRVGHQVETLCVASQYFSVLGVHVVGRDFTADDDRSGSPLVGVLSDRLWRDAFQSDRSIVGRSVETSHGPMQIIGVAAPGFGGARLGEHADVWIPRALAPRVAVLGVTVMAPEFADRMMPLIGLARLKPGVSAADAARAIATARTRLVVYPLRDVFAGPGQVTTVLGRRTVVLAIGGAALLILCGGCTTLMTILIVSYERRRPEFGVRLALGATPMQLARRLGAELIAIALTGAAGGLTAGALVLRAFPSLRVTGAVDLARLDLAPDWRVLAIALTMTIVTLGAAAIVPLRRLATSHVTNVLQSRTATAAPSSLSTRRAMLALHTAATVVVIVGAALFLRTLAAGLSRGAGFDVDRTLFVELQPSLVEFFDPHEDPQQRNETSRRLAAYADVVAALGTVPGVEVVTQGEAPVGHDTVSPPTTIVVAGSIERHAPVLTASRSPQYLRALGLTPVAGRPLEIADAVGDWPRRAVLSTAFAESLGGVQTVVGRLVDVGDRRYEVVGVVPDLPCGSLRLPACGRVFTSSDDRLNANGVGLALALRTSGDASRAVSAVRRAVARRFPKAVRLDVATGRDLVERDLAEARTGAWFFSGFGAIGLVLGVAGVFGLVAYLVESRRREIAVRMALGAQPGDLVRRVVAEALWPVAAGAAGGLAVTVLFAHAIRALIIGVGYLDPRAYGTGTAGVIGAAALAAFAAGWRVRRSSPADALREW